jgi:DNA-nicking Smr family endonuclease
MSKRRTPQPTPEDLALWEKVAENVAPLSRRPKPLPPSERPLKPTKAEPSVKPAPAKASPSQPAPRQKPQAPRLAPLDRRMRARVARGAVAIDARLDLHGLTQSAAHSRLRRFVADCQDAGAKIVLVITGKGRPGETRPMGEERGVLKRMVPVWLGSAELRSFVIGFETAGRGHGGEGALYVRIRGRRDPRS